MKQISLEERVAVKMTIKSEIERLSKCLKLDLCLSSKDYYRKKKKALKAFLKKIAKNY